MDDNVSTRIEALFAAATEAVTDLIRGLDKIGMQPTYKWREVAEEARGNNHCVQVNWGGLVMDIPVADLHLWPDHLPMFLARHCRQRGASEQDALECAQRLESGLLRLRAVHEGAGVNQSSRG